jgi:hypothetical protein
MCKAFILANDKCPLVAAASFATETLVLKLSAKYPKYIPLAVAAAIKYDNRTMFNLLLQHVTSVYLSPPIERKYELINLLDIAVLHHDTTYLDILTNKCQLNQNDFVHAVNICAQKDRIINLEWILNRYSGYVANSGWFLDLGILYRSPETVAYMLRRGARPTDDILKRGMKTRSKLIKHKIIRDLLIQFVYMGTYLPATVAL